MCDSHTGLLLPLQQHARIPGQRECRPTKFRLNDAVDSLITPGNFLLESHSVAFLLIAGG